MERREEVGIDKNKMNDQKREGAREKEKIVDILCVKRFEQLNLLRF